MVVCLCVCARIYLCACMRLCVPPPEQTALLTVVRRDSFASTEKEIFLALSRWSRHHGDGGEDSREVMAAVRLPLMSLTEMLNVVRPSGLLSPDQLLDAIKTRSESRDMDLNYRGMLRQYPPPPLSPSITPVSPQTLIVPPGVNVISTSNRFQNLWFLTSQVGVSTQMYGG